MTVFKSSLPNNQQGNGSTTTKKNRSNPKIKVTKPPASSNQNPKKQLLSFLNLDSTSSTTSSSSSSSSSSTPIAPPPSSSIVYSYITYITNMLFPSTPLFNSVTGAGSPAKSGGKGPKLRHSLFNRSKKQQQHEQQEPTTKNSSTTGWSSSSPWPGWIGDTGESRKQSTYPSDHNGGMNPTNTPSSKSWMLRPSNKSCKSDTEATTPPPLRENFFKKKKKTLVVNSSHVNSSHDEKSCTSDNEVGSAGEQIMLRPYYNLSNPSVMSINNNTMYPSSTSSPPPNDQLWLPPQHYQQQQQHYSLQEQSYFFQNHQLQQQQQQQQQGSQQQLHHPSRRGVTLAVHDVFGLGKVIEMILALFVAHDAFLFRRPIWMQCAVMLWEAIVVLLIIWGILRVVGLAEIVVWGADDLVRGTFSTIKTFGNTIKMLIWR